MSNVGKATDGMLDHIIVQKRRIDSAIDFAVLAAAAEPQATAYFKHLQAILNGSAMLDPLDGDKVSATPIAALEV